MRLHILVASPLKEPGIRAGVEEYAKRARQHFDVRVTPVKGEKVHQPGDAPRALDREAERLRKATPAGARTAALAVEGTSWTSERFAEWLGQVRDGGTSDLVFYVGSAYGLDPGLTAECQHRLSLSAMTLPHQLAILFLTEQVYRASAILAGAPYHK